MPSYTSNPAGESRKERIARHKAQTAEVLAKEVLGESPELEGWDDTRGAYANPELVMGAGVVSPPGMRRYSAPYASLRAGKGNWGMVSIRDAHMPPETLSQLGVYGWAESPFSADDTAALKRAAEQGKATVTVRDSEGNITIRPISDYTRKRREAAKARKASEPRESAAERMARMDYEAMQRMGTLHDDAA